MIADLAIVWLILGANTGFLFSRYVPKMPFWHLVLVVIFFPLWIGVMVMKAVGLLGPKKKLVDVTLELLDSGKRVFRVNVRWKIDPRHASHIDIAPESMPTTESLRQKIFLCAAALAEKHCAEYKDTLDPQDAIRMASESFKECIMNEAQRIGKLH